MAQKFCEWCPYNALFIRAVHEEVKVSTSCRYVASTKLGNGKRKGGGTTKNGNKYLA